MTAYGDSLYFDNYAEQKKRAGKCVRSGCDSEPSPGLVTCEPCRVKIAASRVRLKALRAAQQKREHVAATEALEEREHRVVRDGRNEFVSVWNGFESLYALQEQWAKARR